MTSSLRAKYPDQFRSSYLGTSVRPGWLPTIDRALARIQEALPPEMMAGFFWKQIKQKFGQLRMYWEFDRSGELAISEDDQKACFDMIYQIVEDAEHEAERTCHTCGRPGRLYAKGYFETLCDEHAEFKEFPPVYGEWISAFEDITIGTAGDGMSTERVMYFSGVALYSWCNADSTDDRDYVFVRDMPPWLVDLLRMSGAVEMLFRGKPAFFADEVGRVVEAHSDQLLRYVYMTLPEGAQIDLNLNFKYWASRLSGVKRPIIDRLVRPRDIVIASLSLPDGTSKIFKQEYGEVGPVESCPNIFLEKRAQEFEKLAKELRTMLAEFKQSKQG